MSKKPKGKKTAIYFRESDMEFYNQLTGEAEDLERSISATIISYARMGFSMIPTEDEMLCERCKGSLID